MNIRQSLTVKLFCWLLFLQIITTLAAKAQPVTLSAPGTGNYYSNTSITLLPGFSTSGPFGAYITGTLNIPLAATPSQNQNYILIKTYKVASTTEITSPLVTQQSEVIQYLDGLGRPSQTIQINGSPLGNDIVQPVAYDAFDRETVKYLPYAEQTGNGTYRTGAVTTQAQFYSTSGWDAAAVKTTAPYSRSLYDASPLNQLNEQGAPGTVWQPAGTRSSTAGRTMAFSYGTNDASTTNYGTTGYGVRLWKAVPVTGQLYKNRLSSSGNYASGQLYLKITKDENWLSTDGKKGTTEEYMDRAGQLILKRTFNTDLTVLSTYYVYDDLGNLSFVLPPASNPDGATISQTVLDQFCYQYRYDGRYRQAEKKIPGKGWDYLVYNNQDQAVLMQDSVQRISGKWMFNKYDALGRLIITGLYASTAARTAMETTLNNETVYFETPLTTGIGYTTVAYPQTAPSAYFNIQYYDNYTFPGASGYAYTASSKTRGLLTGSLTYVLGTTNALLNVNYYDDEGRVSKIYKQHYQSLAVNAGNYDEVTNSYNFEGALMASTRLHHNAVSGNTTIASRFEYDQVGRKLRTFEKFNTDAEILLSENSYNEIGQLKSKALHNGLQSTSFAYNERGWLKKSTSPQFSFQLNYQDGTTAQYNGNISNELWGTGTTLGSTFTYNYDRLNRLSSGIAPGMSETLTYDLMGNISTLNRDGVTRNYAYSGNRLTSTSGAPGTGTYLYDGNGNATYDGRIGKAITYNVLNLPSTVTAAGLSYVYDAAGNKLRTTVGSAVTNYVDGIQYSGGAIQLIQTEEGIARRNGTSYSYEYDLKDHLGNVRYTLYRNPSTGLADRLQSDDYYAFGLRKSGSPVSLNNKYLYNGKELQDSIGQYDYGARFYDPVIGRWNVVDPSAEKSRRWSPYNYAINNPIRFVDPDGKEIINIEGGVRFTGADATIAFTALQQQSQSGNFKGIHFVNESQTPEIYRHTLDAFRQGQPSVLHYDSNLKRRSQRRYQATKDYPSRGSEGLQRDEYPYASTFEGGEGAAVAYVPASENSRQGLLELTPLYKTLNSGDAFLVLPVPKDKEPDAEPQTVPSRQAVKTGARIGVGAMIGIGIYEAVKWGVAVALAPETLGGSLVAAGVTP